jgi:chromate transporter
MMYHVERDRTLVKAALQGVAPAAVGLILATTLKLGRTSFSRVDDVIFVALTVVSINRLHVSVPHALLGIGLLAIMWYGGSRRGRPR